MEWKKVTNLITATATAAQGAGPKHQDVRQRHSDMGRPATAAQTTMQQVQQAQQQQQKMALTATVKDANFAVAPGTERIAHQGAAAAGTAAAAATTTTTTPKRRASDIGVSATTMERAVLENREEFIRQEEENIRRVNEMTECINSFKIGSSLFKCDLFMGGNGGAQGLGGGGTGEEKKKKKSFKDRVFGRFKGAKGKKEELTIIPTKSGIVKPPPQQHQQNGGKKSGGGNSTQDENDDDIFAIAGVQGFALSSK